ncbi:MAG: DNA-processing protein DprA [Bacteroidia bacterium]
MAEKVDLIYKIAIKQIPLVGDVLAKTLISYCGGVKEVFHQSKSKLLKIPSVGETIADNIIKFKDFKKAENEIEFIEKHKINCLFYLDENYPWRLKDITDAPVILYTLGNANLNAEKIVGIVGTRKISEHGKAFTQQLVEELKEHNCLIVSGLAIGVDVCAHKAALDNNLPTVGVLAHGLDRIYPATHKPVAKKMLQNGGLITDFTSNTNPDRENFPKRNRIVAGLSDVLVVVETAIKGGARITAEIAHSYNKDIMAVPGRLSDYYSQGCNYLIKENKAAMLTCTNDLIDLMGWHKNTKPKVKQNSLFTNVNDTDKPIVTFIQQKLKAGIDEIAFALQMDAGELSLKLLELEFNGIIRSLPGKQYEIA